MTKKLYSVKITHLNEMDFNYLVQVVKKLGHYNTLYVQEAEI